MAQLGDTFLTPTPNNPTPHLWIVITSPCPKAGEVIIVNITSKKSPCDTTTELSIGDHGYIAKPSIVLYSDARLVQSKKIDAVIADGTAHPHNRCSDTLLARIQKGILDSPYASPLIKSAMRQAGSERRT